MAYTPTTWVTGDTVTATKLNKIENGIANAGSALICNATNSGQNYVLDKTAQEIYDALLGGTPAYIKFQYGVLGLSGTGDYESTLYLAPIIKIYGYAYTNDIRIVACKPTILSNNFQPAIAIFYTSGLSGYPVFDKTRVVNNANVTGDVGIV